MKWYVVKNEWGYWVSDLEPFDSFGAAYEAAQAHGWYNVVTDRVFALLEKLPPTPSSLIEGENPETD